MRIAASKEDPLENRTKPVLHRQQVCAPYGDLFSQAGRHSWAKVSLRAMKKLFPWQNLELFKNIEEALAEIDQCLPGWVGRTSACRC